MSDIKKILKHLDSMDEGTVLARPKVSTGELNVNQNPKEKKPAKHAFFKELMSEVSDENVERRLSKEYQAFKEQFHNSEVGSREWKDLRDRVITKARNKMGKTVYNPKTAEYGSEYPAEELEEYGASNPAQGGSNPTGSQQNTAQQDPKAVAQTQKTLQTLKPVLQAAGGQGIDVNKMTQTLAKTDAQPGKQPIGQDLTNISKLAPAVADALKNPQSAELMKQALQKGAMAQAQNK